MHHRLYFLLLVLEIGCKAQSPKWENTHGYGSGGGYFLEVQTWSEGIMRYVIEDSLGNKGIFETSKGKTTFYSEGAKTETEAAMDLIRFMITRDRHRDETLEEIKRLIK